MNKTISFIFAIAALILMMYILKPFYDGVNNTTTGIVPLTTNVTVFETAWFQILPYIIPGLILVILVYKYIRRED